MKTQSHPKQSGYLEVYQELTRLISGIHDPQKVMNLVVERLPVLLEVDAATIRLFDTGTNSFVLGAAYGVSQEYLSRNAIDSGEVMAALMQGKPIARSNVDILCKGESCISIVQEGIKSAMSLPIIYKERIVGLLRLLTKDKREFSESEINFAMSLAEQVGVAIVGSSMFEDMENQVRFFKAQRQISTIVNSTLDLERIIRAIVDKLPQILDVKGCTIRLIQPATNRLELYAASGLSHDYLNRGSIHREDSIFKVLGGEPVAIYDAQNDPRVDYHIEIRKEGIHSILAVPIKNKEEIIGVLRLLSEKRRIFSTGEINFAVTVAEEGGNAIEKARTYRKITLLFNQIEEQERFLQTILDSLWMQIVVVDPDKRIIMANKHFLERQMLIETDVLGHFYDSVTPWHEDDSDTCPVKKVVTSASPLTLSQEVEDSAGRRWYERHLSPVVDGMGRVEFVIEAIRDITSRKLLESEKMERVKLEGIIEMAGTAAHELNSPLFAALGTAQLLRDDLGSVEMIAEMDIIIRNMKTMADMTRKMTAVTGFESRQYTGKTRIVALNVSANKGLSQKT